MDVLKILILSVLLVLPFGELIRVNIANGIVIKPIDALVGLVVVIWLVLHIVKKKKIYKINLTIPIIIFSSICVMSLLVNSYLLTPNELFASFLYLLRWLFYSGLYFVVREFDQKFKNKILLLMTIIGGIFVFMGYIQYFFYQNLRNLFYLGWDDHLYRMFSSLLDPNFAGAFFVLYFLLLIRFLISSKNSKLSIKNIILSLLGLSTIIAIILTYSRSALIMFFVSLLSLLVFTKMKKKVLMFLGSMIIFYMLFPKDFNIENVNLFRVASSEARIYSVTNAIEIIRNNTLIGVGFNAYRYAQIRYGFRGGVGAEVSHADSGTDNSFLFIFATTGIFGLITYIYILYKILKQAFLTYALKQNTGAILVMISLTGLIINSLFINSLFYPLIMLWMWIIIGVMDYT